ncbi:peptide-methionine (S)-S-oxide reductase [Enterococcus sp. PF1-24]|uniref:peptide-methionine (S)-S-oxide reductase MsrA n=1 Tax=unclassified Enterococcus TaxID=2608891 RepID=UPI002474FB27|nr:MULTISPECIES: peptide-methionine (S)-S-oxide reductase MsrA [unclassified Enterococcus]MDH6364724.1 peptide-methionine (S)-S-oxide reductase [Enterococcus sp. PFB1-1]MDH6401800.1 peptide-methionine (S)-S-oxide reductase [Enterococcus sp. PF1-24]
MTEKLEQAIFAGGCFWCMVQPFDTLPGIHSVLSGYTGGHTENPTYAEVKQGNIGHTEAVEIIFEPALISYQELLAIYWQQTDPTDAFGQFEDRGDNYRPIIFFTNQEQQKLAEASKQALADSGKFNEPIVTTIEAAKPFYVAELEHQEYYKKHPMNFARNHERRAKFINNHWETSKEVHE